MHDDLSSPNNNSDTQNNSDFSFKKPEEVAAEDSFSDEVNMDGNPKPEKPPKQKRFNLTKKQKIILIVVGILVLLGLLAGAWVWAHKKPAAQNGTAKTSKKEEPKPTTEPSKLTGLTVAPDVNQRQVTAVMIENSPDARPQSGLKDAGLVFEAVAEGGITRFLTLYQDTQPDYIGPIRSARPYYLDFALPFDAALAHVGGSPDALAAIKSLNVKDLDQFANSGAYQRIKSRYAPHNVYSSIASLKEVQDKKGFTTSKFDGFERKKESPAATPAAASIDVNISGFLYNPHWDYDKTSNSYKRSQAGKPHTDEKSGQQLTSKVVVVLVMTKGVTSDGHHTAYGTTGSGKMYVFQDGVSQEGTWKKADSKSQFKFVDGNGNPISLNPGYTWVSIVSGPDKVSSKP